MKSRWEAATTWLARLLDEDSPRIDLDRDEIPAEVLETLEVCRDDFLGALKRVQPSAVVRFAQTLGLSLSSWTSSPLMVATATSRGVEPGVASGKCARRRASFTCSSGSTTRRSAIAHRTPRRNVAWLPGGRTPAAPMTKYTASRAAPTS